MLCRGYEMPRRWVCSAQDQDSGSQDGRDHTLIFDLVISSQSNPAASREIIKLILHEIRDFSSEPLNI